MTPSVSVLMPVWNGMRDGKNYLVTAIESILDQTYSDFEFVIVDDGSTDRTSQVLLEYTRKDARIRTIRINRNSGIANALNDGLEACSATLVARQDSDDISTVTRLEIQKRFMDERPDTAMCGTGMYVINEEGKLIMEVSDRPYEYRLIRSALKTSCPFVHGSVMIRRDVILRLGGYSTDKRYQHAEDYEMWVRMAKDHVVENIPRATLYFHRNHPMKVSEVFKREQSIATKRIEEVARRTL